MKQRNLARDDAGVTEVIGFVLSFALSAIFLMLALSAFWAARDNSDQVITAVELKTIANRVAQRVVEAGLAAQEFPNATFNISIDIPMELNGHPYYVEATPTTIYVNATDSSLSAEASTFRLDAIDDLRVQGRVASSHERLVITSSLQDNRNIREIAIHEA